MDFNGTCGFFLRDTEIGHGRSENCYIYVQGVPKKVDPLVHFDDNFGKYGPILTILSLLQQ